MMGVVDGSGRWEWLVGAVGGSGLAPLLGQGGVAAPSKNGPVPLKARTGWFVQQDGGGSITRRFA